MGLVRFAARDPGAANVLAAVAQNLPPSICWDAWCLPKAASVFERYELPVRRITEEVNPEVLGSDWASSPAHQLITGTSHYQPFEHVLWQLCRECRGKSLALLDSWSNIPARFRAGRPDWIGAIDESQRDDLIRFGITEDRIVLTGHPWIQSLLQKRDEIIGTHTYAEADCLRVLHVSEPISHDVNISANAPYGFDEMDSFLMLHKAAAETAEKGLPVLIRIRLHPYEDAKLFSKKLKELPRVRGLCIELTDKREDAHALVCWADLVTGISSMLLLESIVLAKPVISLQPGLARENTFIAAVRGYAATLTNSLSEGGILVELLSSSDARESTMRWNAGFLNAMPPNGSDVIENWILSTSPNEF